MKIIEILYETEDHIKTYWAIHGINIDSYYRAFEQFINDTNKFRGKNNVLQLGSYVHELLTDATWQNLEGDPDFDKVYDGLLDLYQSIQELIST